MGTGLDDGKELRRKKRELRRQILDARESLSRREVAEKSERIGSVLFGLPGFAAARTVMFYIAFQKEVDTKVMVPRALALGKRVAAPRTLLAEKRLVPYLLLSLAETVPGVYGILEPPPYPDRVIDGGEIDLVVVPGVAFDALGYRVGYGGGFYDRFLSSLPPRVLRVSLAYELQIVPGVPRTGHDVPVDVIITEDRLIRCKGG